MKKADIEKHFAALEPFLETALELGLRLKLAKPDREQTAVALARKIPQFSLHENFAPMWALTYRGGRTIAGYIDRHPEEFVGKTVLDVGSGSGLVALTAAKAGATAIAVDSSPFAAIAIQNNAALNGLAVEIIQADFMRSSARFANAYARADIVTAGDAILPYARPGSTSHREPYVNMFKTGDRLMGFVAGGKTLFYANQSLHLNNLVPRTPGPGQIIVKDLGRDLEEFISFGKLTLARPAP